MLWIVFWLAVLWLWHEAKIPQESEFSSADFALDFETSEKTLTIKTHYLNHYLIILFSLIAKSFKPMPT